MWRRYGFSEAPLVLAPQLVGGKVFSLEQSVPHVIKETVLGFGTSDVEATAMYYQVRMACDFKGNIEIESRVLQNSQPLTFRCCRRGQVHQLTGMSLDGGQALGNIGAIARRRAVTNKTRQRGPEMDLAEHRRLTGDLIEVDKIMRVVNKANDKGLFPRVAEAEFETKGACIFK
eukprot:g42370.t1